ncbi:MAG: Hpt domain-containing protein [Proteobacteria bacterium]|nr:Hpt domain-containing protein [Pseudomonadota bacterium]
MSHRDDKEILSIFVAEVKDHLEEIEHGILLLESNVKLNDPDLVHKMFRAAHSIKAGANLMAFKNIEAVAHHLEEILHKVRYGQYQLAGDDVSHFLIGIDKLNELIDNIHYCDLVNINPLLNLLNSIAK